MSVITKLDLPTSPRAAVFRAMETIVRQNSVFNRIVKPDRFRTWQGRTQRHQAVLVSGGALYSLDPDEHGRGIQDSGHDGRRPTHQLRSHRRGRRAVDDLTNFWWLLTRCFYPPSGGAPRQAIIQTLQAAGARSGLVLFSQPAFDPGPDGVFFAGQGQIKIEIQSQLNS